LVLARAAKGKKSQQRQLEEWSRKELQRPPFAILDDLPPRKPRCEKPSAAAARVALRTITRYVNSALLLLPRPLNRTFLRIRLVTGLFSRLRCRWKIISWDLADGQALHPADGGAANYS
jgi:hypothetical protein